MYLCNSGLYILYAIKNNEGWYHLIYQLNWSHYPHYFYSINECYKNEHRKFKRRFINLYKLINNIPEQNNDIYLKQLVRYRGDYHKNIIDLDKYWEQNQWPINAILFYVKNDQRSVSGYRYIVCERSMFRKNLADKLNDIDSMLNFDTLDTIVSRCKLTYNQYNDKKYNIHYSDLGNQGNTPQYIQYSPIYYEINKYISTPWFNKIKRWW